MTRRVLLAALSCLLAASMAACAIGDGPGVSPSPSAPAAQVSDTLTVATEALQGVFSPFFAQTAGDAAVAELTQLPLICLDAEGQPVPEGGPETGGSVAITENPDGSVDYDITLKPDLRFSDGAPVTIDDLIFTLYVCLDPSYDGPRDLLSLPIAGLEEYCAGESPQIAGLVRTGALSLRLSTREYDATTLYQLCLPIAPRHYYGAAEAYDYDAQRFGFPKGDLSAIRARDGQPMGAGPYVFGQYDAAGVRLDAREGDAPSAPGIAHVRFVAAGDVQAALLDGAADMGALNPSAKALAALAADGQMVTRLSAAGGYGYLGISPQLVKVGDAADSPQSRALRKAIATVLAAGRQTAVAAYYGDAATVECPGAYALDASGRDIYTEDMDAAARYAAACQAALGYFAQAGYTVTDGVLTAAPEGASLRYRALICAGGVGDHPAYALLEDASEALASIGLTLEIRDVAGLSQLTAACQAGQAEIWCGAWELHSGPDLFPLYHSQGAANLWGLGDPALDAALSQARHTPDPEQRAAETEQARQLLLDMGVEVPLYTRSTAWVFAAGRVDVSALPARTPRLWTLAGAVRALAAGDSR